MGDVVVVSGDDTVIVVQEQKTVAVITEQPRDAVVIAAAERGLQGARGIQGVQGIEGPQGSMGPQGPVGPPGGLDYTHQQMVASSEWIVEHHLGRHCAVTVVDSAGSVVVGDVAYLSLDVLSISFGAGFSGTAYCI